MVFVVVTSTNALSEEVVTHLIEILRLAKHSVTTSGMMQTVTVTQFSDLPLAADMRLLLVSFMGARCG